MANYRNMPDGSEEGKDGEVVEERDAKRARLELKADIGTQSGRRRIRDKVDAGGKGKRAARV